MLAVMNTRSIQRETRGPLRKSRPRLVPRTLCFVVLMVCMVSGCRLAPTREDQLLRIDALGALAQRSLRAGVITPATLREHGARLGNGWHVREPTGRWTSAHEATLVVPLTHAGPGRLEIRAAAWGATEPAKRLIVTVNGFVLPGLDITREIMTAQVPVPDGVFRGGDNRIVLDCETLHRAESRDLGIFVEEIRLVPEGTALPAEGDATALVVGGMDWVQDLRGGLVGGALELRWRSVGALLDERIGAELVLVELDERGGVVRDLATAAVIGDSGAVRLDPLRRVDVGAPARLCLRSADPGARVEIVAAQRVVPAREDVLLIVIDTLRADALGAHGSTTTHTPHLDRLAAEGTLFRSAVSHAPITGPSHAAIFQSLLPSRAGIVNNHEGRLDPQEPTLPEILSAHGYACRSAVSISPIVRRFGFGRGFDEIDEELGLAFLRNGGLTTSRAERWLAAPDSARPRFTFVHLADPHEPYDAHDTVHAEARIYVGDTLLARVAVADFGPSLLEFDVQPGAHSIRIESDQIVMNRRFELMHTAATGAWLEAPPPSAVRKKWEGVLHVQRAGRLALAQALNEGGIPEAELRRRYALEVDAVDRYVGRLLAALDQSGRAERTWVIFTADHGEEIGDHGQVGHVNTLFEELVHVPLIVRPPTRTRAWSARIREDLAAGVDVMPTILDLVGIDVPGGLHGRSLRTPSDEDRAVFLETHAPQAKRTLFALRSVEHKIIWAPQTDQWRFFDLVADPGERNDLVATGSIAATTWRRRLLEAHREHVADQTRAVMVMDADSEAALRSLGYVE